MSRGERVALDEEHPAMRAGLLILDDLGAERVTDWQLDVVARIVEHHYDRNETNTIVTSNYSPADLARRLGKDDPIQGERIVSRLIEGAIKLKLDRADLRVRKAA